MATLSPLFQQLALTLAAKRTMLRREAAELTTLALGSSHGDFGFDPGFCPGAFNLCCRSQDLRHSHAMYERAGRGLPRLRNLVLFFSVFSPGHVLERSPGERDICLAMHEILDLDLAYADPDLQRMRGQLKSQLAPWAPIVEGRSGFLPGLQKEFFDESYGVQRRAEEHLKLNRGEEPRAHLTKTMRLAESLGHRVLVVIPPARSDYRRACGAGPDRLFESLGQVRAELGGGARFEVLDLFADADFTDSMFGDFDHLDPSKPGVRILSSKVQMALPRPDSPA